MLGRDDARRRLEQLQQHLTDLRVDDLIAAKHAAEVLALEMEMKHKVRTAVLCCTVLCCAELCYAALRCAVLCCAVLRARVGII